MKGSLTDAIKEDHAEMYEYHDKYKACAGDQDAQQRWSRQLIWEIARHAVAEEIVVYPLMEKHLSDKGKNLADRDREDHQSVKEDLAMLETATAGTTAFETVLDRVMKHLHEHNGNEEVDDLPLLEPKLGEDGSRRAARQFSRTKMFAPTRAHPAAPNRPPYETVAAFLSLPIDKLKDAFSKFPDDDTKSKTEDRMR
ncbi:hypothetical protein K439DRAFT_1345575 [Ramaria rubella]|nr:hypothetical protein K439DRAFT_1345575 [Ramaria rubella]